MRIEVCDLSDVSIVVLSYNRRDALERNLFALISMVEKTGCELIVVDNASSDGSAQMIEEALTGRCNTRFIANSANLGVAGGRNAGWRVATREFILNIDDDTFVTAEAVAVMLSTMRDSPKLGVVSPQVLNANGAKQFSFADLGYRPSNFHGACHLVRRALIDAVGLNDEDCTFGGEELDLSIRARTKGFEIGYVGQATVLHDNLVRKAQDGRARQERWLYNFIRIHSKHFPLHASAPLSLRYLSSHLVSGVRNHGSLFGVRLFAAAIQGFCDGRRQRRAVPGPVVRFYRNPDLRPEFGNVPLRRKALKKLTGA
jgi:GT2 family glycosyltransferase